MQYIATIVISLLSISWPLLGVLSFLFAQTGMVGFLEELGILGPRIGGVRPDNIAIMVSIILLLRRPRSIRVPESITFAMWIITFTVPVGSFFMNSTTYDFLADSWRGVFWAPTFIALSRLSEKEWDILKDFIILLLVINSFLTFFIVYNGDYKLYIRLSQLRLLGLYPSLASTDPANTGHLLRPYLPGTFSFGCVAVFLCFQRIFSPKMSARRQAMYVVSQICILGAIYLTLTRTSAVALVCGLAVMISLVFLRTQSRQKAQMCGLILVACLAIVMLWMQHSGAAKAWEDRLSGRSDEYHSAFVRLENNILYWNILTHSFAIIGHPDFDDANVLVGGYKDVIAPLAIWWYYGLIAAICYVSIVIYVTRYLTIRCLATGIVSDQAMRLSSLAGMFVAYQTETLGGSVPTEPTFGFLLSFVIATSILWISEDNHTKARQIGRN